MRNKILSISIASYNVEKFIEQAIESYLQCSCKEKLEVLIVNDGSTDKTEEIVSKYSEKYPDIIKLINQKNAGPGSTVNTGLNNATGKYFRMIDGDDWIKSDEMTGLTEWYYANSKGVLQDGWQKISNKWYYFDYEMYTGYEEIDGKYYFFNKSGAWVSSPSGWQENKYGEWYYFRNGKAVTEWQKISGKWYYFYRDFAVMCNTYVYVDGKSYMFNKNGTWISNPNGWISDFEGDWYYFRNGKALTGWQKISSKWYYFGDEDLPIMFANRYEEIDGKYYYFNSSGVWISKPEGWRKSNDEWFYFKNGKPVTGWLQISGKWYLFYKDEGWMITGWWDVNNKWYYFNSSGVMQTGIVTIGDLTYNLGSNGAWDGK